MKKIRIAQIGLNKHSHSVEILEYLQNICNDYGTKIEIRDGTGYIKVK